MATETVLIDFQVDYSQLETAQAELAKSGKIDTKGIENIQKAINTTATDTKGLIKTFKDVATASVKMGKTVEDAFGAGIQDALDEAGVSLDEFQTSLKKANAPATTLKKELLQLKESMARMKAEGKDTGKEFDALRQRAGKLSDAIADANQEIKNAGSDTRGIDNVVGSISALAGGYAAVQGAAALFGEENEDVQKALLKVNGAMALAQGLQVVYNATLKEGAIAKLADSVVTGTQTAATALLTFVTTGATTAAKAYRVALLATGIGAVVVLVLALVSALDSQADSMEEVNKTLEANNDLIETSNKLIEKNAKLNEERAKAAGAAESDILRIRGKALVAQFENITRINKALVTQRDQLKATSEGFFALNKQIEENKDLQADIANQIEIINIQGTAQVKKEVNDRIKLQQDANKKYLEELEKKKQVEIKAVSEGFARILQRFRDEEEQLRIHFENEQEIIDRDKQAKLAIEAKWEALRQEQMKSFAQSSQAEIDRRKKENDEEEERIKKRAALIIDVGTRVAAVYSAISAAQTERDNQLIASQRKVVEDQLRAGVITQKAALARLARLDQAARDAQNRAAKREKQAAVFSAALAIPKAVLQGLSTGGPILAAIYGALAAVEFALIASRPVPKFFRGKKDKYAGPGTVADMGSEIVERDGRMYLYTKPTQTYLGANDKVYTASETRNIMHNTNINTTVSKVPRETFDYAKLAASIPVSTQVVNIDKDFISESVANGLTRVNYMDRRYSSRK